MQAPWEAYPSQLIRHEQKAAARLENQERSEEQVMKKGRIRNHPFITASLIGLTIGLAGFQINGTNPVPGPALYVGMSGMFLCMGAPFYWYLREGSRAIDRAFKPVPSPQEIHLHFVQTQGREPTVQEVAAIHQMLTSQHNEDLLGAAAMVGGAYLGARAASGKKTL
jgi:hypothetical protein